MRTGYKQDLPIEFDIAEVSDNGSKVLLQDGRIWSFEQGYMAYNNCLAFNENNQPVCVYHIPGKAMISWPDIELSSSVDTYLVSKVVDIVQDYALISNGALVKLASPQNKAMFLGVTKPFRLCKDLTIFGKYYFRTLYYGLLKYPADYIADFKPISINYLSLVYYSSDGYFKQVNYSQLENYIMTYARETSPIA